MAEFVIKLADERGRVHEQVQTAATADELRSRFTHAGYHVFSVRARGGFEVDLTWKNGSMVKATIKSKLGGICKVSYAGKTGEFKTKPDSILNIVSSKLK